MHFIVIYMKLYCTAVSINKNLSFYIYIYIFLLLLVLHHSYSVCLHSKSYDHFEKFTISLSDISSDEIV